MKISGQKDTNPSIMRKQGQTKVEGKDLRSWKNKKDKTSFN